MSNQNITISNITNIPSHSHTSTGSIGILSNGVGTSISPTLSGGTHVYSAKLNTSVSMDDLIESIELLKSRMLILTPLFEQHDTYPALKEAYSNYLMIERMVIDNI